MKRIKIKMSKKTKNKNLRRSAKKKNWTKIERKRHDKKSIPIATMSEENGLHVFASKTVMFKVNGTPVVSPSL
jgi:hypothetical protein